MSWEYSETNIKQEPEVNVYCSDLADPENLLDKLYASSEDEEVAFSYDYSKQATEPIEEKYRPIRLVEKCLYLQLVVFINPNVPSPREGGGEEETTLVTPTVTQEPGNQLRNKLQLWNL